MPPSLAADNYNMMRNLMAVTGVLLPSALLYGGTIVSLLMPPADDEEEE